MNPLIILGQIVAQTLKSVLPETPEDKLKAIELSIQQQVTANELFKANLAVNEAEANNPNRKWVTWRELIGYAGAAAIWWNYVLQPMIVMVGQLVGHPVDTSLLVQLPVADLLGIICGMLGIAYTPQAIGAVAASLKRNK